MRQRTRRTVALAIFTGLATAAHAVIIPPTQPRFSWDAGAPGGNTGQWQAHIGGPKPLKFAQGGGATAPSRVLAPSALPGITAAYAFDGAADNCVSSTGNDNFFQNVGITDKDTTFELWVRPTSLSGGEQVLFESGGGVDGMSFLLDDDTLKWRVKDGGEARTLTFTVPDPAAIADFNQVVGVYDRDTGGKDVITLYLNGNNVVATDASNNNLNDWAGGNATGIASVGSGVGGTDNGDIDSFGTLDGQVAIVRVYDQALDGAAVQEAYEAVTSSTLQPRAGRFTANQNPTTATYPPFDGPEAGGDAIGFTTSLTYAGTQDGVARNNFVRDGALSAFFDESKSQDGSHAVEDFGYVVASPALPVGEIRVDDWGGLKCLRGTATVND
ncbi:MAG: LamG-like jellyroll fold domain-containing protein, partial [bacterium]